jgi:hypothetical protein
MAADFNPSACRFVGAASVRSFCRESESRIALARLAKHKAPVARRYGTDLS